MGQWLGGRGAQDWSNSGGHRRFDWALYKDFVWSFGLYILTRVIKEREQEWKVDLFRK